MGDNNDKYFIKIPNYFFEQYIKAEELYLYYYLLDNRQYARDLSKLSIDDMRQEIKFMSRDKENKKKIYQILMQLINKEYIKIEPVDFEYNTVLRISFPYLRIENKYSKIFPDIFDRAEKPEEFLVLCILEKWKKVKQDIAIFEWSKYLNKSPRRTQNLLNDMNNRNIINIESGAYYINEEGMTRQEVNEYSIVAEGKEAIKHSKKRKEIDLEDIPDFNNSKIPEKIKYMDEDGNNSTIYYVKDIRQNILKGQYLKGEDFMYINEYGSVDSECKKVFDRRYNAMKKSENGFTKNNIKNWNSTYTTWKNTKNKEDLLNEYGFIMKLKNGQFIPFDFKHVKDTAVCLFMGTWQHDIGFEQLVVEEAGGKFCPNWYSDKTLKNIVDKIRTEGKDIDIHFIDDYKTIEEEIEEERIIKVKTENVNVEEDIFGEDNLVSPINWDTVHNIDDENEVENENEFPWENEFEKVDVFENTEIKIVSSGVVENEEIPFGAEY